MASPLNKRTKVDSEIKYIQNEINKIDKTKFEKTKRMSDHIKVAQNEHKCSSFLKLVIVFCFLFFF